MRASARIIAIFALTIVTIYANAADLNLPTSADLKNRSALPIDLTAESSEIDNLNQTMKFNVITITQGTLSISADSAQVDRTDFENTNWHFKGNVKIKDIGIKTYSQTADIFFQKSVLLKATLKGSPAKFQHMNIKDRAVEGRGLTLEYNVADRIMQIVKQAWFTDTINEMSSDQIIYNMNTDIVTALGPVRMKIVPPPKKK
jgi:lipopolysaccharide transport protein LptA